MKAASKPVSRFLYNDDDNDADNDDENDDDAATDDDDAVDVDKNQPDQHRCRSIKRQKQQWQHFIMFEIFYSVVIHSGKLKFVAHFDQ